jgi:hypothetical protein
MCGSQPETTNIRFPSRIISLQSKTKIGNQDEIKIQQAAFIPSLALHVIDGEPETGNGKPFNPEALVVTILELY